MTKYKIYTKGNYIVIVDTQKNEYFYGIRKEVHIDKSNVNKEVYRAFNVKDFSDTINLQIPNILKEDNSPYTEAEFDTFYQENTGNFNGGGTAPSSIITAPPINGIGETVLTFDNIRYYQKTTQTGDIELSLNSTGNLNGRSQVIDIDGLAGSDLIIPTNWSNSNGVAFDSEKNNVIYLDYVNGKVKYNITKQDLPDITPPSYLIQEITNILSTSAKFNVKMSENSNVYWYLSTSITPPSKAAILSGTGSVNFGVISAIANVLQIVDLTELTLGVTYYLYSYADDLSGNETSVQISLPFVTGVFVLASDNFNSANVTNIAGRTTPVGGFNWVKSGDGSGTIGIVSNALKNTGITAILNNIYSINVGVRNVDVSVKFKMVGTSGSSNLEIARVDDANRYYLTSAMNLRKVVEGTNTLVSSIGGGLSNGDVIRCVLTDTTITVYKNGISVYSGISDVGVIGTKVGLYIYQDDVVEFEDLIVY